MQHLFPDSFLASIAPLSIDIRPAPPRAAQGAHLSPRSGASLEFRDYQGYTPGDDLRRIDWSVYARTRHLFVRRFEHPTAVPVFILVDASESMRLESPSRYATAARIAAAVASAALASQNPVFLSITGDKAAAGPRAVSGRRGLVRVLAELAADGMAGTTGIAAAIQSLHPFLAGKGCGVLVVISDFFEQRGIDPLIDALRAIPQRIVLTRVTQPWDADPAFDGDSELMDCESDAVLRVSVDAAALANYRRVYESYFDSLNAFARARGAAYTSVNAAADTLPQLEALFPQGVLTV